MMSTCSREKGRSEQMRLSMTLIGLLVLIIPGCLSFQPSLITTTRHGGGGVVCSGRWVGGSSSMLNFAQQQQRQPPKQTTSCLFAKRGAPKNKGGSTSNNSGSKSTSNTPERTERVRKPRDDVIEVEATVQESLPNAMFRCSINNKAAAANGAASDPSTATTPPPPAPPSTVSNSNQPLILATISGKIRQNMVKILVGDRVLIELSPYDLTRGRITFRYRS